MGGRRFKTSIDNMISQIFKGQQKCVYVYSICNFETVEKLVLYSSYVVSFIMLLSYSVLHFILTIFFLKKKTKNHLILLLRFWYWLLRPYLIVYWKRLDKEELGFSSSYRKTMHNRFLSENGEVIRMELHTQEQTIYVFSALWP